MSGAIAADNLRLGQCEDDCPCQSVHIILVDADGDAFATSTLSPDVARRLAADLVELADLAEARLARLEGRQI